MSKSINISENDIIMLVTESVKKLMKEEAYNVCGPITKPTSPLEDDYDGDNYSEIAETKQLKDVIRRMVNEALDTFYGVGGNVAIANAKEPAGGVPAFGEKLDSAHGIRKQIRKWGRDVQKKNGKEKGQGRVSKQRRSEVLNWLKEPELDCAEIMRKLWNPSPKHVDSARSYFYKCRDGKLNDSGVPYRFSDKEINALYRIKSETAA